MKQGAGIIHDILTIFRETQSIKAVERKTGCSWPRVVKILSSNGVVINEIHAQILKLHEEGRTPEEIAKQVSRGVKTVQAYLPKTRPYYRIEPSKNAERIRRCRERKEN